MGVVSQLIGIGIGIGIGIELTEPVFAKLLADRIATLSELSQHGRNTIEECLLMIVVFCGQRLKHFQHVRDRCERKRRISSEFKKPASISVLCFAVILGNVHETLKATEHAKIRAIPGRSGWRIRGEGGVIAIVGLKPTKPD